MELLSTISQTVRENAAMVELFNWNEICKLNLPDAFILDHSDHLNWDVLCKYQAFSMTLVEKFDYLIKTRLNILVTNANLSSDVFKFYADKMDWESAQKNQKFTPELLEHFRDGLDLVVVLQHQTMPEQLIQELLVPTVNSKQWHVLRKYLTLVFTYQKVSNNFINHYLVLENTINTPEDLSASTSTATFLDKNVNTQQIVLVDLPIVIKNQNLDEKFLATFCIPYVQARNEICRSQTLTNNFINTHFDQLDLRKLLKYQRMDDTTLMRCCERGIFQRAPRPTIASIIDGIKLNHEFTVVQPTTPLTAADLLQFPIGTSETGNDNNTPAPVTEPVPEPEPVESQKDAEKRLQYANLLIQNQVYSLDLVQRIINSFTNQQWRKLLWCGVFLRTLAPIGNAMHLGFDASTVNDSVLPNVNWDIIANSTDLTNDQVDGIIKIAANQVPWYLYVKKNTLIESQIEALDIDAITWWRLLTTKRTPPFTHTFLAKHDARKNWWNYISSPATFYTSCLQALDNIDNINTEGTDLQPIRSRADIRSFLSDFVATANWKQILHDEVLPDWFIQLFGHKDLSSRINLYWWNICRYQHLKQSFIDRNITKLDLQVLLINQTVEETFLRNNIPFFTPENWKAISTHQTLSDEFRTEFASQLA